MRFHDIQFFPYAIHIFNLKPPTSSCLIGILIVCFLNGNFWLPLLLEQIEHSSRRMTHLSLLFTLLLNTTVKVLLIKSCGELFFKTESEINVNFKRSTGGPPLMRFSLPRIPLPWFLAYVRASGGLPSQQGIPYSPTNATVFFQVTKSA